MELAWLSGESSATEAAGSLTLGMAWWAFSNHCRNQPGGWDKVGGRACSGDGDGRSWDDLAGGADSSGNARLSTQLFLLAAALAALAHTAARVIRPSMANLLIRLHAS